MSHALPSTILSLHDVGSASTLREEIDQLEMKLPRLSSLAIIIICNALMQISFFSIVASSNAYSHYLGGSSSFSGLVIGIPTVFSAIALVPLTRLDKGRYKLPLHVCCLTMFIGSILYAAAYRANFLYLILLGRIVTGFGFSMFMYTKRYCSDSRIVGIRQRTTLAGWLVVGQGIGLSAGPFFGGLLFKIGFSNDVFNGFTSPGWIMAVVWVAFWICVTLWYEEDPAFTVRTVTTTESSSPPAIELDEIKHENGNNSRNMATQTIESSPPPEESNDFQMSNQQWGVIVCMCWYAMTCFFILGAWESNIPVYSSVSHFHWSPFASGNFLALGGITTFPFLLLNLLFARRLQDRHILAFGSAVGLSGLVIMITLLRADKVTFGSFFVCWFLVALGFNVATTVTVSLLSKQLPGEWNHRTSLAIQCSNYLGRVTGAVWGGSGVKVGMLGYVGLEIAIVAIGAGMFLTLYRHLKSKTG